ncbi:hypothetical protein [Tessaracoccus coleopterorum]|nr:hypothetical protein [Tessaracoccus coleopterorum]
MSKEIAAYRFADYDVAFELLGGPTPPSSASAAATCATTTRSPT